MRIIVSVFRRPHYLSSQRYQSEFMKNIHKKDDKVIYFILFYLLYGNTGAITHNIRQNMNNLLLSSLHC